MKTIHRMLTRRRESRKPLIENNNQHTEHGCDRSCYGYDNPWAAQNTFNTAKKHPWRDDDTANPFLPEPGDDHSQKAAPLCFPQPPADLDQNLQQHLDNVEETVLAELVRLRPLPAAFHRQMFDHLHGLLLHISSSKNSLLLMRWVLHTYVSQEDMGRPDGRLFSEWEAKAKDKLLANVKTEVRDSLDRILQGERCRGLCDTEEDYIGLYVDTIQCTAAIPREAQKISSELCEAVQEVCFQELLRFVKRYAAQQAEVLGAEMEHPQTIHYLKTLKTCKELKQHVHSHGGDIKASLLKEIVAVLEDIEDFTLKFLMDIVTDIAERHFKDYFKADNRWGSLSADLEKHFPKLSYVQDEQKAVMYDAYQIIAQTYLRYLIQSSRNKLRRYWRQDVGPRVADDADKLHNTISRLAPGVQHFMLLKRVSAVLDCRSTDAVKLDVASIQKNCFRESEDVDLLYDLLRWKGLSKRRVREVLDALPGCPSTPSSSLWSCGFSSCCC
ncbi:uncharacterized protein LOC114427578 [Parambassis ranga]|uniref:Uncharacterized protein LOC114427578 n=1 Tax=Parambassis ranga TaxID=210632 RepID=A0A6P7HBV8_9TELE|nr:uncharacterized protein LOC114427578 [Parambassis ranga]